MNNSPANSTDFRSLLPQIIWGQDNYIQLQSFKGEPGKRFSIEVTLSDTRLREYFEL
jgi:hypothetical protein